MLLLTLLTFTVLPTRGNTRLESRSCLALGQHLPEFPETPACHRCHPPCRSQRDSGSSSSPCWWCRGCASALQRRLQWAGARESSVSVCDVVLRVPKGTYLAVPSATAPKHSYGTFYPCFLKWSVVLISKVWMGFGIAALLVAAPSHLCEFWFLTLIRPARAEEFPLSSKGNHGALVVTSLRRVESKPDYNHFIPARLAYGFLKCNWPLGAPYCRVPIKTTSGPTLWHSETS